jgi:hypothetical protein
MSRARPTCSHVTPRVRASATRSFRSGEGQDVVAGLIQVLRVMLKRDNTVSNNSDGGGIYNSLSRTVTLKRDATATGNTAARNGGGITN